MTQLIIGTVLGVLVAQGLLYGARSLIGWLRRGEVLGRIRLPLPAPGPAVIAAFVKYAAPVGVSAALLTLGVWVVSDFFAAKSARNAAADTFDSSPPPPLPPAQAAPAASAALAHAAPEPAEEERTGAVDPYADPAFRVQRRPRRSGSAQSLKETLVQQSEARARNALLHELQQHVHRSQYDCEAAERADKYLKAGLDVWGFATWQVKYFPVNNYRGATLERCKDIKSVAASVDLQSAVAQQSQNEPER